MEKIQSLQALRGIAILIIMMAHCELFIPMVQVALSLFIMLSGFVLTYAYCDKEVSASFAGCVHFVISRIKKLYPLHVVTLLIALCLISNQINADNFFRYFKSFLLNLTLLQIWYPRMYVYFGYNAVAWFLSLCLFLYFCFPKILQLVRNTDRTKSLLYIFLIFVAQMLCGWLTTLVSIPKISDNFVQYFIHFFPLFRVGDFIAGCLLGNIYLKKLPIIKSSLGTHVEILAIILIMAVYYVPGYRIEFRSALFFVVSILYKPIVAVLLFMFVENTGCISRLLSCKVMIYIGNISAYIFLMHQLIIRYIRMLSPNVKGWALFALTLLLSVAAVEIYMMIERKIKDIRPNGQTIYQGQSSLLAGALGIAIGEITNYIAKLSLITVCFMLLMAPLALKGIERGCGWRPKVRALIGYTDKAERPKWNCADFLSRKFQDGFTRYWNAAMPLREHFIRGYNQLRYSAFALNGSWKRTDCGIIGNNGTIYHEYYINDALQIGDVYNFSLSKNQKKAEKYVDDLMAVDQLLKQCGKRLIFYITPSKADFDRANIPLRYRLRARDNEEECIDAADYLATLLAKTEIAWYDSRPDMRRYAEAGNVCFYKTGSHLSSAAEHELTLKLLELIEQTSGIKYGEAKRGEVEISPKPFWREQDVYSLLNVYKGKKDKVYHNYPIKYCKLKDLNIMIQGGSFAYGFYKDLMEKNMIGSSIYYIFYDKLIYSKINKKEAMEEISRLDDIDLAAMLQKSDYVVIEVNDAAVASFSRGVISYIREWLEKYGDSFEERQ